MSVEVIAVYFIGAMGYALLTYGAKRSKTDAEPFDARKLTRTLLVGLIVGGYAYARGLELSLSEFSGLAEASGATVLAEQLSKILWRNLPYGNQSGAST